MVGEGALFARARGVPGDSKCWTTAALAAVQHVGAAVAGENVGKRVAPNGNQVESNVVLGNVPSSWTVISGRSDFNGDGRSDILRRSTDGTMVIWQMNGAQVTANTVIGVVPTTWAITDPLQLAAAGADTTVSVDADGIGGDFVAIATLQNVAFTAGLLNELVANGNLALT